jgi:uncharacterized membrane protein
MSAATSTLVAWEIALQRSWRKVVLTFLSGLSLAAVVWQVTHPEHVYDFVFQPGTISAAANKARRELLPLVAVAAVLAAMVSVRLLKRARHGALDWPIHREVLLTSLMGLPLLVTPSVEFDHPVFTALVVSLIGLAIALAARGELESVATFTDLSPRQAWLAVFIGFFVFLSVIGFISYWRYITFHAEVCDMSWEVGAVHGILNHGVPTVSVAAWLYDGKPLPQPYFNNHVPFVDYLFVPFYAIYKDARTLLWVQAGFMGAGAFGAHMIGRRWLKTQIGGVLFAWLYVLNPSVQSFCLHDVHANVLIIPALMLAVGFMEAGRAKTALAFALLAAVCREEAPLYAAGIGLYWMLGKEDRLRFRYGLGVLLTSVALVAFFSLYLMPAFGGKPRWEHFSLFFDNRHSAGSMIGALVLNPMGAAFNAMQDIKFDYLAISLVPAGGLALFGWKAGWFLIPAFFLLLSSNDPAFYCLGMNYSAPLVPGAVMMGLAGVRRFLQAPGAPVTRRAGVVAYVLATALFANYLYGNIASKSYKFEYGNSPLRRQNQRDYRDILGYIDALPPYGPAQKALWEVIRRVPEKAPVLTSWAINPQLSERDVALVFTYSSGSPPPERRVHYIVIDKLPALQTPNEQEILRLRADPRWRVIFENESGVIFEVKDKSKVVTVSG